jgi:hypothetical protein
MGTAEVPVAQRDQRRDARDIHPNLHRAPAGVGTLTDRPGDAREVTAHRVDAEKAHRESHR